MIGMNYRLLGYVFDQKRIRGAVWRLVWNLFGEVYRMLCTGCQTL